MADPIVSFRINPPVIRLVIHGFLISTILLLAGCGNSPINSSTSDTSGTPHPSTINLQPSTPSFRLHWLGKKRLSAESNATNFISIWNMPESLRLESQTLDKLSTAPWRLLTTISTLSNAPSALLRPLLNDLIQEESYVEVSASTNVPAEIVLAIKLPADRVALWQTNLPLILNSLQPSTFNVQPLVTNIGNWTILSISDIRLQTPDVRLLSQVRHRLSTTGLPFAPETTNFWISGRVDFSWLSKAFSWNLKSITNLPVCEFSAIGDGTNVRSLATLTFPGKVPIELEPWNIPAHLVHDPLSGFMAIRGLRPLLKSFEIWNETKFGTTPDQITLWAQEGNPALHFFALPSQQSSNQMRLFSQYLIEDVNPKMAVFPNTTNVPIGSFEEMPGSQRLRWRGIPYIMPNLNLVGADTNAFIVGGLFQNSITNKPAPESLLSQFKTDSNIILYDWELTKSTAYSWIQMSQAARFVFGLNRLSITNNPALPWIVAVSPKLDFSGTTIRLTSPQSISVTRSATIGLTGLEIHLLSEWLESPEFPKGFFSINSKSEQQTSTRRAAP